MSRKGPRPGKGGQLRKRGLQVPGGLEGTARIVADEVGATAARESSQVSEHTRSQRARRRSRELLDAVGQLDVTTDPATQKQLVDWIRDHYAERAGGELVGLFAKCYLGDPYVDHHLAISHEIVRHFTVDDDVPPAFAAARSLVRSPAYLFVEVYSDGTTIPVRANGDPVI